MEFEYSIAVHFFLTPAFTRYSRWRTGGIMGPDISTINCVCENHRGFHAISENFFSWLGKIRNKKNRAKTKIWLKAHFFKDFF